MMDKDRSVVLLGVMAGVLLAGPARAHDLWVVPGKFHLGPGEKVRVFLNSGDEFPLSASLLGEQRVERLSLQTTSGVTPLGGFAVEGKSLTFEMTAPRPGSAVLALKIRPRLIRLNAEEFNDYLKEDDLPHILELRSELGEMEAPAVERYTKWAKAILIVGEAEDDTWSKPVGLEFEILPEKNPYQLRPGDTLPVSVLYEGEPVAGLTVSGGRAGGPRNEVSGLTDADGRVSLRVAEAGRWYIRTVHMIRRGGDQEFQWESFWTTLTFEVVP